MPPFGNAQLKLLEKLCNVIAISGDEGEVRKIVLEEVKPYADEVRVDALGSVLATKFGRVRNENRLRVMLDAHMDEVGLMIVADEGEGLYRFEIALTFSAYVLHIVEDMTATTQRNGDGQYAAI